MAQFPRSNMMMPGNGQVPANGQVYPPAYNDHTYQNVKLPPSMRHQQVAPPIEHTPSSSVPRLQQVAVSEIISKLDFVTGENMRLKKAVQENNNFFEQKLREYTQDDKDKGQQDEVEKMKGKVSEATNRFFEARVAVMGYKCQVMLLQGQLDKKQPPSRLKDLEEMNRQLQEEVQVLGRNHSVAEEERQRLLQDNNTLQDQLIDKETRIQQLQAGRQSSHEHTLRGQVQELQTRKGALEGDVSRIKARNDELLCKVKEMEQTRETMMQKLDRLERVPVPKPRGQSDVAERSRLEQDVMKLQEDLDSIRADRELIRMERDRANQDKLAVDAMFQGSNRKSQNLTEENLALQADISRLQEELSQHQLSVEAERRLKEEAERRVGVEVEQALGESEALRADLKSVGKERSGLAACVNRLERRAKEQEEEVQQLLRTKDSLRALNQKHLSQIAQLEAAGTPVAESVELKSYTTSIKDTARKRLNDALGRIRELETIQRGLEEEVEESRETNSRKMQQLRSQLEQVEDDLRLEKEEGSKTASEDLAGENARLRTKEQQTSVRVRQLESEQQRQVEETLRMRSDLDRNRQDLSRDDSAKRDLTRQISEKEVAAGQLREQLRVLQEQLQTDKSKKSNKFESLQQSYTELKATHTTVSTSHHQLQSEVEEKQRRLEMLVGEKQSVVTEKKEVQVACEEFRKESESLLSDYNLCAQRLKHAQDDVSQLTAQHQKDLLEQARQRDRVSLLEKSRKEQDDKLNHMDQQIKIYHEDFDRERNAREAAVKVKNLAEDRMKKMDRELKELRERLNQHAVRSLREEHVLIPQYEDPAYSSSPSPQRFSDHHNRSGEHQPSPAWNAPSPNSGGPPRSSQQEQQRARSGELLEGSPGHGGYGGARPAYRGGPGGGGPGGGGPGGGGNHNAPWTTVNPPSQPAAAHYHHTNKTTLDRVVDPQGQAGPPQAQPRQAVDYRLGVNDLNNPPSAHMPDMATNDYHATPSQGLPGRMDHTPASQGRMDHTPASQGRMDHTPASQGRMDHAPPLQGRMDHIPPSQGLQGRMDHAPPSQGRMDLQGRTDHIPPSGMLGRFDLEPATGMGRPGVGNPGTFGPGGLPLITLPGDINNLGPPTMACPICNRDNFKTQTELELHSAQCI